MLNKTLFSSKGKIFSLKTYLNRKLRYFPICSFFGKTSLFRLRYLDQPLYFNFVTVVLYKLKILS